MSSIPEDPPGSGNARTLDSLVRLPETSSEETSVFPIVGLGASAGGLAAFEAFFSGVPAEADPGVAFVVVQHLAPDHKSNLTELVRRYTRMDVFEVVDGMEVKANTTYIIPPNHNMAFVNGRLKLTAPISPRGQRLPIDFFFQSLAKDQRDRAICVVLSGTGSDGTLGARAVKGAGGMVIVQDPASAEYDGMPRSAIAAGVVDYQLPPGQMPAQIIAYLAHSLGNSKQLANASTPEIESLMRELFGLLRDQTGHDFSQCKPSTVQPRIARRMAVHLIEAIDYYVKYVQETPTELGALFRELLIGVTSFFRDSEAFVQLEEQVIPKLFAGKSVGAPIRVWSPGCSTGEEAYSIAILLAERQEALKLDFKIQLFATDIDAEAIRTARAGLYPASITADISPERLARFFEPDPNSGGFRILKSIRELVIFSEHDLIKAPPFSKLDLLSCRNLLIYMGGELQKKLIPLLHYSLNPDGFLFLGNSESLGEFDDLFIPVDRDHRLFQRKADLHCAHRPALRRFLPIGRANQALSKTDTSNPPRRLSLRELTEGALLEHASAGALVDRSGDILYLHGRTGMFLEPAAGGATISNILTMAREGLRRDLTMALHKAAARTEVVRRTGVRVKTNGDFTLVNLTVRPVITAEVVASEALYLVVLEQAPSNLEDAHGASSPSGAEDVGIAENNQARIAELMKDLREKDEHLLAANEELAASNEELRSTNEELRSTNEELETSSEELQSLNEELITVNAELQNKVAELSHANNLVSGTGIGTVFVDLELRIFRFTPGAEQLFNLIPGDVGRPISHVVFCVVGYGRLAEDIQGVLDSLIPREVEVQTRAGAWYTMRILPYRTLNDLVEGAVITFVDITERRRLEAALRDSERIRRLALQAGRIGAFEVDLESGLGQWTPELAEIWGIPGDFQGDFSAFCWDHTHPDDLEQVKADFASAQLNKKVTEMEFRVVRPDGETRWIRWRGQVMQVAPSGQVKTVGINLDITEQKRSEEELVKSRALLSETERTAKIGGWEFDVGTLTQTWTDEVFRILEIDLSQGAPKVPEGLDFIAPAFRPIAAHALQRAIENGEPYDQEWEVVTAKGNSRWVHAVGTVHQEQGKTKRLSGSFQDITQRKRAQAALWETQSILKAAMDRSQAGIAIAEAPSGKLRYVNDAGLLIRGGDRETVVKGVGVDEYVAAWQLFDLNGDPLPREAVPLSRAVLYGETNSREFVVRRVEGDDRVVRADATPITDENGKVTAGVVVFHDITNDKRAEAIKAFLARTGSSTEDKSFFSSLARYLAEALGMEFVCIDRLEGDGLRARTLAVFCDGHFEDNVTYDLKDTPCGDVVGKTVCCFPASVCQFFPRDQVLQDLRAESYVGVTLFSHEGKPIGLIAVIGRSPLIDRSLTESLLKLVAERAASELERCDSEEALRESEERYHQLFESASDALFLIACGTGAIVDANEMASEMYGYSRPELTAMETWEVSAEPEATRRLTNAAEMPEQVVRIAKRLHRKKNGSVFPVEITARSLVVNGKPFLMVAARDISDRVRAEEEKTLLSSCIKKPLAAHET